MRIELIAIAAMGENRVIGHHGQIPWHLPTDLKFFQTHTLHRPLIMGRKTWESLPKRPLPHRPHFVVSTQPHYTAEGATVCPTLPEAFKKSFETAHLTDQKAVMVIGGGEIYRAALPFLTQMLLTHVHQSPEGDCTFPDFDPEEWTITPLQTSPTHTYMHYVRKASPPHEWA